MKEKYRTTIQEGNEALACIKAVARYCNCQDYNNPEVILSILGIEKEKKEEVKENEYS